MAMLFFDTETTGMIDRFSDYDSPRQPHIVQLGAILADESGRDIAEPVSVIVKPEGWEVSPEAAEVHGITTEMALARGIPLRLAVQMFDRLLADATLLVAHNFDFDRMVVAAAYHRLRLAYPFRGKDTYCTMRSATPVCRLPGPYGFKWPTLSEAYRCLIGKDLPDAHDALMDVKACKEIYFALRKLG